MKYRYPLKSLWLPALLLALCLSLTLFSTAAWLINAAANDSTDGYTATIESVLPALVMLAGWIGSAFLAKRLRLRTFLLFGLGFWSVELICYLLCLIPSLFDAAQAFLSIVTLPMWSYFALVQLIDVKGAVASVIVTSLPTVALIGVYLSRLIALSRADRETPHPLK